MRFLLLLVVVLQPQAALCQNLPPSPLARADITATLGSFSAHRARTAHDLEWTHSLLASAGAGYYWTDHLKTELDVESGGRSELFGSESAGIAASPLSSVYLRHAYRSVAVSAGQSYQFGRNALWHPFVAAGVDLERVRHEIERPAQSVAVYTLSPSNPQIVQVVRQVPVPALSRTETDVTLRPYGAAGFKAYFSERGFFRSDLKVRVGRGIDRVILRAGFGVDF